MCVTSAKARLSSTRILSIPVGEKHLLAYSNSAENLSGLPNSMILPVPGELGKDDFVDTTKYPNFLKVLEDDLTPQSRGIYGTKSIGSGRSAEHFKVGMYEVLIASPQRGEARTARSHPVQDAIRELPPKRRPAVSRELLSFYDHCYPGWSLVVCVFDADKAMDSQPIMFTYRPLEAWRGFCFFPAVDSHTGGPPDLASDVQVDHFLITEIPSAMAVQSSRPVPPILHGRTLGGIKEFGMLPNGDWVRSHVRVRAGMGGFERLAPSAAVPSL